jgi:hypothetical protein
MPVANIILTAPETYIATIDGMDLANITPASQFYSVVQDAISDGAEVGTPPVPTAEEILAAERAQMNPFAAAFWQAMKQVPAAGFSHLLDRVDQTVVAARAVAPYADIVLWSDKVTQVVRLHPEMETFRVQFGASETELDDLFRLALQIEGGA